MNLKHERLNKEMDLSNHLVSADEVGMKYSEPTNKPNGNEAVNYENIRQNIFRYCFPDANLLIHMSLKYVHPRKRKHIYAQSG